MKVIVFGSTGMVGEGVTHECLHHPEITEVLLINRKVSGIIHDKIREIILKDMFDFDPLKMGISGLDACYFCLGVSSMGMSEKDYSRVTYDLTLHVARKLLEQNDHPMTMIYVSGEGTDSSEKGRLMWARVKGRTENAILQMGFKEAYAFRPGIIIPTPGLKNTLRPYKYLGFLIPVIRRLFPSHIVSLKEIGQAMIHLSIHGQEKKILENRDIQTAAKD